MKNVTAKYFDAAGNELDNVMPILCGKVGKAPRDGKRAVWYDSFSVLCSMPNAYTFSPEGAVLVARRVYHDENGSQRVLLQRKEPRLESLDTLRSTERSSLATE